VVAYSGTLDSILANLEWKLDKKFPRFQEVLCASSCDSEIEDGLRIKFRDKMLDRQRRKRGKHRSLIKINTEKSGRVRTKNEE